MGSLCSKANDIAQFRSLRSAVINIAPRASRSVQRQLDNMSQRSFSTVVSSDYNQILEGDDDLGVVETEVQRRDRLREEAKIKKQNEESNAGLREEIERKRIELFNQEESNRKKKEKVASERASCSNTLRGNHMDDMCQFLGSVQNSSKIC